uniref:Transposase (Putative), gypsy type n=1 Tax=Tanacetum cinerariifolium TaxID=118510 RepID=A0A699HYZ5_TANCI|nr:transposase (putative), gypsy type [Tanacetum cinerariifolium]
MATCKHPGYFAFTTPRKAFSAFCEKFHIPQEVHLVLPNRDNTIHERPVGKIRLYTRFFDFGNFRLPLSTFLVDILRDPALKATDFNAQYYTTLIAHPSPFWKFLEEFLCLVGLSRHYTLDEDTYPSFVDKDGEDMDIFAFIHTLDPTKVKVVERERDRTIPLLSVAPDRGESEMESSVDKLFDEGGSGTQEDHETLSGASRGGKSRSAVQQFFIGAVHNTKVRGDPISIFHFVTSSVSVTPEREGEVITAATTVTSTADPAIVIKEKIVKPSLFFTDSALAGGTDPVMGSLTDLSASDFLVGGIRTVISLDTDLQKCMCLNGADEEIKNLKAQLLLREAEVAKSIHLRAEASHFEVTKKSLQDEVNALNGRNTILEKERDALDVKVTDLEATVVSKERELTDSNAQLTGVKSQNDDLADQVHTFRVKFVQ